MEYIGRYRPLHAVGNSSSSFHTSTLFLMCLAVICWNGTCASLELLYVMKTIAVFNISQRCALINAFNLLNKTLLFLFLWKNGGRSVAKFNKNILQRRTTYLLLLTWPNIFHLNWSGGPVGIVLIKLLSTITPSNPGHGLWWKGRLISRLTRNPKDQTARKGLMPNG